MPFDRSFDDTYQLGIRPACDDAGAYAARVDEQIFTESVLQRVYNQIAKADILVSDMTGRSAETALSFEKLPLEDFQPHLGSRPRASPQLPSAPPR